MKKLLTLVILLLAVPAYAEKWELGAAYHSESAIEVHTGYRTDWENGFITPIAYFNMDHVFGGARLLALRKRSWFPAESYINLLYGTNNFRFDWGMEYGVETMAIDVKYIYNKAHGFSAGIVVRVP